MKENIKNTSKWLKEYCDKTGFDGYVIGLSGGIDSAVSMSLAVKSMGTDKVLGIILPCTKFGERLRTEDIEDAQLLADTFGVKTIQINLDNALHCILDQTIKNTNKLKSNLVSSNIKARLRMTTLRSVAESNHYLVLGTTNKTEEYLSYFTKCGDGGSGVDVEPIIDFFKFEIFQMAKEIEINGKKIPEKIINRIPSAGLFDDQTDENEIGYLYKDIDNYLIFRENCVKSTSINNIYENLSEIILNFAKLSGVSFEYSLVQKIENMIVSGQHKRLSPPGFIRK